MPKRAVEPAGALRLLNHGPTVMVTAGVGEEANIITLAWTTPVSIDPPMIGIAVAPPRHTHGLIAKTGEFIVNVPSAALLGAVWHCGRASGRNGSKFESAGLTAEPAVSVETVRIAECFAHIECRVASSPTAGDHTFFIGEITAAAAEAEAFDGYLRMSDRYQTLHHLGGTRFVTPRGEELEAAD